MTVASSTLPAPNLMPLMRYRDLAEAMSWLERAFGFEKQIAVSDNDGEVIYGQMTYRGSPMMMGAVRNTDLDNLMRQPDEVGDVETQTCYLVIDDADAHYARAVEAGAEIVLEIKSDGLGRRGYSCRDPQGHIWNFGTYNPAQGLAPAAVVAPERDEGATMGAAGPFRLQRAPMMFAALLALGTGLWWFSGTIKADFAQRLAYEKAAEAEAAYAELAKVRAEKRAADARVAELGQQLEAASTAPHADDVAAREIEKAQVERTEAEKALAQMRAARLEAEAETVALKAELERQRRALEAANEAKRITEEKLAVKSAAEDARVRESAQQPRQPDRPPVPLAGAKEDPLPAAMAAETPPPGSKKLETSATSPLPIPSQKEKSAAITADRVEEEERDEVSPAQAPQSPRRAVTKRFSAKKRSVASRRAPKPPPPTYVINLREVPWPYNAWYK